jgi:hypothetical protein
MSGVRFVVQDGAGFYRFADRGEIRYVGVVSAPFTVKSYDMSAARKARDWYKQQFPQHIFIGE